MWKILSSKKFPFTTNFTTNKQQQYAQSCSNSPQSVILEYINIITESLAKQGIPGQKKEKQNYDKSTFHLPRQCLREWAKALSLLGFLDGNVEFTPHLHLWKIESEQLEQGRREINLASFFLDFM